MVGVGDSGDGGGTIAKVPGDGVGVFDAGVAVSYAEVEGFALVEAGSWGGEIDNRGGFINFDCGGLLGATAVFIGDGEGDSVVTVVGVGVGDIASGDGGGAVAEVPSVGEVVATTAVGGGGGEVDGLSFGDFGGDGYGLDGGGEVVDGEVDGGEVRDLSVGAETEVGEAVIPDVGGDGLVGKFAVGGLGECAVGGLVDDLDLGDVGVVGGELGGGEGEGGVLVGD